MADRRSDRFQTEVTAIERLLDDGRAAEAVGPARALRALAGRSGDEGEERTQAIATASWFLGRALAESGEGLEALAPLDEARRLFVGLAAGGNDSAAQMAAACLTLVGDCLRDLGRLDEAAGAYRDAIGLSSDERGGAAARAQLSIVLILEERYDQALAELAAARETFEALGETSGLMAAWYNTGMAYRRAGDLAAAERAFREALTMERELGDRRGEAETLAELAVTAHARGRLDAAVSLAADAASIAAGLGEGEGGLLEARARGHAATVLLELGRLDAARREAGRAAELEAAADEEVSEPWTTWGLLADVERAAGDAAAAAAARQRALAFYLAYRRGGGESQAPGRELLRAAVDALVDEEEEATLAGFSTLREKADLPSRLRPLLEALSAILSGDHDPALAAHPDLSYMDAAELALLLEALDEEEPS